jgi:hypothetical protein
MTAPSSPPGVAGDLATVVARFAAALHAAGLPIGADRSERFARAILLTDPQTTRELYLCALATMVSDPGQVEVLDRVFGAVFGGLQDLAEHRGDQHQPPLPGPQGRNLPIPAQPGSAAAGTPQAGRAGQQRSEVDTEVPTAATGAEQLASKDFADLTPEELAQLTEMMSRFTLATPLRPSRRYREAAHGHRTDLRATLRQARRTGGHPLRLSRKRRRRRPRRLVVLCDISGSMQLYSRAFLQLLYAAASGAHAEVFTFATRLTRLTRTLSSSRAATALASAGTTAPDWAGGTRIADALAEFLKHYGRRGMARGAVVLVISDGWETGDPAKLGVEMARLSHLAYRIVWANPRTARPGYRPTVGGMAAAWPYCDAVVSAHSLDALEDLLAALQEP